jgi:hypothetical protein
MGLIAKLEELYTNFRASMAKLQPYNHRPLTQDENAHRTAIIREEILPIRNQIIEIESGLSRGLES